MDRPSTLPSCRVLSDPSRAPLHTSPAPRLGNSSTQSNPRDGRPSPHQYTAVKSPINRAGRRAGDALPGRRTDRSHIQGERRVKRTRARQWALYRPRRKFGRRSEFVLSICVGNQMLVDGGARCLRKSFNPYRHDFCFTSTSKSCDGV